MIGPLPQGKRQTKFVVVIVEYFKKWVEAEALATITERNVTKFIWKSIVCRFRIANTIITDNGREFNNATFRKFCADLNIKHRRSSPTHPQGNGQVEAVNKISN